MRRAALHTIGACAGASGDGLGDGRLQAADIGWLVDGSSLRLGHEDGHVPGGGRGSAEVSVESGGARRLSVRSSSPFLHYTRSSVQTGPGARPDGDWPRISRIARRVHVLVRLVTAAAML